MRKYAIAGASMRGIEMYAIPMARDYSHIAELVGVYDPNYKRADILRNRVGGSFPSYSSFEEMLKDAKPDVLIVTTVDRYHHEYIIKALKAGCDVISEKPMTIDAWMCNDILEAERESGKSVKVTFNLRFSPFAARLKELVRQGAVGKVLSVHFEWLLDTSHGADYFRRWHRRKENSGGLLVHKSTHHFDLVNWILEEEPLVVNAFGTRRFYGPTRADRGIRCLDCLHRETCEFHMDIRKEPLKSMYLDCEDVDGYYRDRCVFSEDIDIEDTMSVNVRYSKGALMSYSLTAHSPYEGYRLAINGTDGRLEAEDFHGEVGPYAGEQIYNIRIYNRKNEEEKVKFPRVDGAHGGGDVRLLKLLIGEGMQDPLGFMADSRAGAMSIMIGIAANVSIKEGRSVHIGELLKGFKQGG